MSIELANPNLVSPDISSQLFNLDRPIKLGVLASGDGSNFAAIHQAIEKKKLNAQIKVLIYNNPEAYVAVRAKNYNIPTVLINHRSYNSREELDNEIVKNLKEYQVDWVIMAGWMRLVTLVLIDAFPEKIINIHPSLLPSFKGIRAIEQALNAGVKITGCTVHLVTLEMDSGSILMQAAVPIFPNDTLETLHSRIQIQEHTILPAAIALAASSFQE
ncbi:MAG: phosphoribosylglycinamide formyltransferase [Mastigocoleus sp.]